jgi:hypothetical protein
MLSYSKSSAYAETDLNRDGSLAILEPRPVPKTANDVLYEIESVYHQRPDLLAHDIYGNNKLWWVFAQRNPDILNDPIFDFKAGTKIYLCHGPTMRELLGL